MKMKIYLAVMLAIFLGAFAHDSHAQKKTIVLVRHVEKDISATADKTDPELSQAGRDRALLMVKAVGKYKPDAIYSTNFKRSRESVKPLAEKRKKDIQIYDASNQQKLVDEVMASKFKKFVIVGHSNTTPALANLFTKKEVFKQVPDTEYSVIWVIRMKNGVLEKVEILTY